MAQWHSSPASLMAAAMGQTADEARARSHSSYAEESELGLRAALERILRHADLADTARIEANIAGRPWPTPP